MEALILVPRCDYVDRGYFRIEVVISVLSLTNHSLSSTVRAVYVRIENMVSRHPIPPSWKSRVPASDRLFMFKLEYQSFFHLYSEVLIGLNQVNTSIPIAFTMLAAFPLAAIMNKQSLCIRGGLSPELNTMDDIRAVCSSISLVASTSRMALD